MSILSYAFGDSVIYSREGKNIDKEKRGLFGYGSQNYEYTLDREIKKYTAVYKEDVIQFLSGIPKIRYLYIPMIVAAYTWYFGNNKPQIFTPDLFSDNNPSFVLVKNTSFPNLDWSEKHTASLLTYANIIKRYNNNMLDAPDQNLEDYYHDTNFSESEDLSDDDDEDDFDDE